MQHAYLCEDVEIVEFEGFLVLSEGIAGGRFCNVLAAGVFVKNLESAAALEGTDMRNGRDIRKALV